jgi:hypothetical protein
MPQKYLRRHTNTAKNKNIEVEYMYDHNTFSSRANNNKKKKKWSEPKICILDLIKM